MHPKTIISHIVMRHFKYFIFLALALAQLWAETAPVSAQPRPFLRTNGTHIENDRGQTVILRGVNLGGWLLEEMWMSPFVTRPPANSKSKPIKDAAGLWDAIEARLGREETYRLKKEWRNSWLQQSDFVRIKAAGFNCVRLPFTYDAEADPDGLFFWLDRAVNWAEQAGLYVVLDMHGAPGRQSKGDITGRADINQLFSDPNNIQKTEKLWQRIASRYRNRPSVAGYDLLNEPMGAPNASTLQIVQDRLYRAIRSVDGRHLIFIEDAYKGFDTLPYPAALGWKNVVLSLHSYDFEAKDAMAHERQVDNLVGEISAKLKERNVPLYLGEFNIEPHGSPEVLNYFVRALERQGYSWSFWTYKVAGLAGGRSTWGLVYKERGFKPIDPFVDSPTQMREKFTQFRTENMSEYSELKLAFHVPKFASQPVENWRYKRSAEGEENAAQFAESATNGADWKDASIGADIFDGKRGFAWVRATLPTVSGLGKKLRFDGVDDNATIYLNGHRLLRHEGWSGSFEVPLDTFWRASGLNEIAVWVENTAQGGGLTDAVTLSYELPFKPVQP